MDQGSRNRTTSTATTGSASACPVCETPLPKKPPSQQRKYCSRTCAGAAKKTLSTSKTCTVCQSTFTPQDRYQAARNKTCSPGCAAVSISKTKTGEPSPFNTQVTIPCATCSAAVMRSPSRVKRNGQTFCSHRCAGLAKAETFASVGHLGRAAWTPASVEAARIRMTGESNPAWKGGVTYKRPKGNYVGPRYVRCPEDLRSMARSDGYVMEHRLVMARRIGRTLLRSEVVHHINHDPRDNRVENLELYPSNGDHKRGEVGRFVAGAANQLFPEGSVQL